MDNYSCGGGVFLIKSLLEVFSKLVHELLSAEISVSGYVISTSDTDGKIFGHVSILNCLDDNFFKSGGEPFKFFVVIKLSSVSKTSSPCEDGSNGVG